MKTFTIHQAQEDLQRILDWVAHTGRPIRVRSFPANAVLVPEALWRSYRETADLLSGPGMRESIRQGLATPLDECVDDPDW